MDRMGCGCNNRIDPEIALRQRLEESMCEPTGWGPIVWKYLHSLAERVGTAASVSAEAEAEAETIYTLLKVLPLVIPCRQCQRHAGDYIDTHPITRLRSLRGLALRAGVREWLFRFHTAVREQNGQAVIVSSMEECQAMYVNASITQAEYTQLIQCVASASRSGWVKIENWRKWYLLSEKLRRQFGDVIV